MSDDKNRDFNDETDIMLALDQLSETMDTISSAIDNLKHSVADAQQSLIDKYSASQANKRAQALTESKKLLTEKITDNAKNSNTQNTQDENDIAICEAPIIIH